MSSNPHMHLKDHISTFTFHSSSAIDLSAVCGL